MEDGTPEDLGEIPAEVESHELGEGEWHGQMVFPLVHQSPDALPVPALLVDGEARLLEGLQVAIDSPGMTIFVLDKVGDRFPLLRGDEGLDDAPLAG